MNEFYTGQTDRNKQKEQNKKLYHKLKNKKDILVLFPDIEKLTKKLCYSYNKFIELILKNDAYKEILNDDTTIEKYFENE